jgi:hypothetical protein
MTDFCTLQRWVAFFNLLPALPKICPEYCDLENLENLDDAEIKNGLGLL